MIDKKYLIGGIIGVIIGLSFIPIDAAIPPTNAFEKINFDGIWYNATSWYDTVTLTSGGGGGVTVDDLAITCGNDNHIVDLSLNNSTGVWGFTCDDDDVGGGGGGETNTYSTPTLAETIILTKVGVDLPFKGIAASGDLSISSNSTDVTISYTDSDTVYAFVDTTSCSAGDFIQSINNVTGIVVCDTPSGGGSLDMKSGTVSVGSQSWVTVTFNTAFSNTPICSATPINTDDSPQDHKWVFFLDVATTGFDINQKEKNGETLVMMWICIEASDP